MKYAKFVVAAVGAAAVALLGLVPANSTTWQILTAVAAVCTAVGVYAVPNKPAA